MRRRLARASLIALLAAVGCARGGAEPERLLPADRASAVVYVALGDSTVEGVGASRREANYVSHLHRRLVGVYPRAQVENLGVGGATSRDVLRRQLDRAIELRPHLVTLSIGPNDITGRVPVEDYERNLDAILGRLALETSAVLVANLLPDLAITPRFRDGPHQEAVGRQTVRFNEALERQARARAVVLVDLYRASQDEVPRRPELIGHDGYHPSDVGYERWAELVWPAVQARIATP